MVWRESFPPASAQTLDAEAERERRLAVQARAGADWALTALIARYQPAVTRYLTRLCGDQGRARELAEHVFQRMERRLHGPHGGDNLRLWLLRASTEVGLETLRRPRRGQPLRLDATRVAGLLPEESGAGPQSALRDRISQLRNVVGAVSRQARPLIWQTENTSPRSSGADQSGRQREAIAPGPVDEALDTLDPREALRHRLVRITLAELPYGDAQCLALHLVAGLNQAEVARALGITGSAARRRIVQGLSQFSERYQASVRSLGLPEELGYGDALPRRIEEEGPVATPEPELVIVPETAEEMVAEMGEPAPATIPLAVDALDDDGEVTHGGVYYAGEQYEESSVYSEDAARSANRASEAEARLDSSQTRFAGVTPTVYELDDESEMGAAASSAEMEEPGEADAPSTGAGSVTRIAADAIVGPVVDALPVHSEPLAMSPGIGAPGQRSTPLAYELASGEAEAGGITMNWIDSAGMMAPLSFEAIVASAPADGAVEAGGDPWERSTILELETPGEQAFDRAPATPDEEDFPPTDVAVEPPDASAPLDLSIALAEGDYGWERSYQETAMSESGDTSLAYEMLPSAGQVARGFVATPSFDDTPDQDGAGPRPSPPVAQTLEDLWDEAPDAYGR